MRRTRDSGIFARPRTGLGLDDCDFYHTMEIPGLGLVEGQWDLRGRESEYIGHVDVAGRRVLEIGPASGFLTMTLERAGASVVAIDTDPDDPWDIVPHATYPIAARTEERRGHMERIRNSWWLVHERFGLDARVHYGHGARLPSALGDFDVAILAAVLLHCRNPLDVLEAAAVRSRTVVITDLAPHELTGPVCRLIPTRTNKIADAWWALTPELLAQFLEVLGYETSSLAYHEHDTAGEAVEFFTLVSRR